MLKRILAFFRNYMILSILSLQNSSALDHISQLTWNNNFASEHKAKEYGAQICENTPDPYQLTTYQLNYLLPVYYRPSDHKNTYFRPMNRAHLPAEIAFQISLKLPIWKLQKSLTTLFAAYTQHSYWQAYVTCPFFRASDYQPEIILEQPLDFAIRPYLHLSHIKLGLVHQSNGMGEAEERTWNRFYGDIALKSGYWTLSLKLWTILNTNGFKHHNPDIKDYLGIGAISLQYTYQQNQMAITYLKKALKVQVMFPISPSLRGMLYLFTGYGESLIEYNHYINSIGLGIALNA